MYGIDFAGESYDYEMIRGEEYVAILAPPTEGWPYYGIVQRGFGIFKNDNVKGDLSSYKNVITDAAFQLDKTE